MKESRESFEELNDIFKENEYDDSLVKALNMLQDDKRNMYILYIACGNNYTKLAKVMRCSSAWMRAYILDIKEEIKNNLEKVYD